jgi:EAL domain-containing protein (putative c-di-GMP-specific phosphodiesterase class I)
LPPSSPNRKATKLIEKIIDAGRVDVAFQPIVDLQRVTIFAYEALVRCQDFASPPELFEAAIRQGVCGRLGREIRRVAIEKCPDIALFLNLHPQEFDEGFLVQPDDPIFAHERRVFLEITESVPLSHFSLVNPILSEIRSKGIQLVVDDLGAGYSNLKYIADLSPDIVKLDRGLIAGLGNDPRLITLVTAIVALCKELGAKVVAEGIETQEELRAVSASGIHLVQGYFLARPALTPPAIDREQIASALTVRRRSRASVTTSRNGVTRPGITRPGVPKPNVKRR